jgi:hypothetical protein
LRFDDLLSRADDKTLQKLLGSATVSLLQLLDPSLATSARLREILLNLHSPESLLLSKESRDRLFKFLRPQEAKILALVLSAPEDEDVYRALQQVKIRRGSENERTLFDFFELIVPAKEEVRVFQVKNDPKIK